MLIKCFEIYLERLILCHFIWKEIDSKWDVGYDYQKWPIRSKGRRLWVQGLPYGTPYLTEEVNKNSDYLSATWHIHRDELREYETKLPSAFFHFLKFFSLLSFFPLSLIPTLSSNQTKLPHLKPHFTIGTPPNTMSATVSANIFILPAWILKTLTLKHMNPNLKHTNLKNPKPKTHVFSSSPHESYPKNTCK